MPAVQLKHGTKLKYNGELYQVVGKTLDRESILLLNEDTHDEIRMSQNEIAASIAASALVILPDVSDSKHPEILIENIQRDPSALSIKARIELERRRKYMTAILKAAPRFFSGPYIHPIVLQVAETIGEKPPSLATIYRWRREYLASNNDIRALTPNYRRRGNRRRRLHPFVIRTIEEKINEYYLVPECPPITHVAAAVVTSIAKRNRDLPGEEPLPQPSDRTIYRAISAIAPDKLVRMRRGKHFEYVKFHAAMTGRKPVRVLERWEMDHCKLDIYLIDDDFKSPYGRPWLTTIIDVYSGMIVGFHLSFESPSRHSAMAALKHAILSKSEHLKVHPDLKNSWDVYGVPSTLVLDNGTEFHSPDFVMACQCLGINIQYTKARSPWLKGTIERFFGSLNKSLLAGMKGYTFPNIDARGDYDPKKNAVIGLRELNTLIYGWIVDFHNQRAKRKGLGIPAVLWAQSVRRFPIPHVSSASDVGVALMSADWRTLTRKGIEFRNLEYNSPELEPITRSLGDGTRVLIKFSPADVGSIYVIHPRTGIPIYVPAKNPMMRKGISEWALAAIHRYSNSLNAGGQRVSLSEAMMSLIDKGKAAAAEAKTGEMSRQAMKFLRDFLHHDFSESDNVSPEGINVQSRPVRVVADPVVQEEFKRVEKEEIKQRLGDDEDWGSGQR